MCLLHAEDCCNLVPKLNLHKPTAPCTKSSQLQDANLLSCVQKHPTLLGRIGMAQHCHRWAVRAAGVTWWWSERCMDCIATLLVDPCPICAGQPQTGSCHGTKQPCWVCTHPGTPGRAASLSAPHCCRKQNITASSNTAGHQTRDALCLRMCSFV